MRAVFACVLAFISSALAYSVTSPNAAKGWTNVGPQYLAWTRVDTDPANFTAVLVNVDTSVMPQGGQVLAALVVGSAGNTTLYPPNLGWPLGSGFRVNLVKDPYDLNTIFAQSDQFSIKPPTVSSTSSSSLSSYVIGTTSSVYVAQTTLAATTVGTGSPSSISTTKPSGSSNGAIRHSHVHAALWGMLGTIGFFLA